MHMLKIHISLQLKGLAVVSAMGKRLYIVKMGRAQNCLWLEMKIPSMPKASSRMWNSRTIIQIVTHIQIALTIMHSMLLHQLNSTWVLITCIMFAAPTVLASITLTILKLISQVYHTVAKSTTSSKITLVHFWVETILYSLLLSCLNIRKTVQEMKIPMDTCARDQISW